MSFVRQRFSIKKNETRRERLKSALYLSLKKVFKIVKGRPFGLFENPVCCKISKNLKGDALETKKMKKVAQWRKYSKGDPIVSSGPVVQ